MKPAGQNIGSGRQIVSIKKCSGKVSNHEGLVNAAMPYFLKEGFKVSKFCHEDDSLLYWYCDIVDFNYHPGDNSLIVTDLLADVIIYPDGFVKVVDLDELVAALESRSISLDTLKSSLMRLDKLLNLIYSNQFDTLKAYIENY